MSNNCFSDQNHHLNDFDEEVWEVCPSCAKQAVELLIEEY